METNNDYLKQILDKLNRMFPEPEPPGPTPPGPGPEPEPLIGGLTFTAFQNNSTIKYVPSSVSTAEYSYDRLTWTEADNITITLSNVGDVIYFRGTISDNQSIIDYAKFEMSGKVAASGSIMSLQNNDSEDTIIEYEGEFCALFDGCESLTSAPELPAEVLTPSCYQNMFSGCYELKQTPEIMAEEMSDSCFSRMFMACLNLEKATHHIVFWSTDDADGWLSNTKENGKVICPSNSNIPSNSDSGAPNGWTKEFL